MTDLFNIGIVSAPFFHDFHVFYIHNDHQLKIVNIETNEIFFILTITFDSINQFNDKVNDLKNLFFFLNSTDNNYFKNANELFSELEHLNLQIFELKTKQIHLLKSLKFNEENIKRLI